MQLLPFLGVLVKGAFIKKSFPMKMTGCPRKFSGLLDNQQGGG